MTVTAGDCLDVMATMGQATVDAIVTDPPYGLAFMGKDWDHGIPGPHFWTEALRVAKPGAHLVAFGGTRTHHRLMAAIEDAGWEIRDCLMWLYGSGFPKSHDISKAIDRANGAERNTATHTRADTGFRFQSGGTASLPAITDLARTWDGWGTALKPAWEPIVLARKPLAGTVAANVERYGVGGLNIDGCRIGTEVTTTHSRGQTTAFAKRPGEKRAEDGGRVTAQNRTEFVGREHNGRWPANVVLDEDAAARLDAEVGNLAAGNHPAKRTTSLFGTRPPMEQDATPTDSGGPSRFYYTAKASRSEREAGVTGPERDYPVAVIQTQGVGLHGETLNGKQVARSCNHHPTVKPLALMRWLCRLVTTPGGLILDPFAGSGSTGCAAAIEGFRFHGIELSEDYAAIARQRIAHWAGLSADQLAFEFGMEG